MFTPPPRLLVVAVMMSVLAGSQATQPIQVKTPADQAKNPKRELTHPAHVLPYEQTDILARVSGYLKAIHVDIGDQVKEGQKLAELSIPEMEQERVQKEALVEQAKAEVVQAEAALRAADALLEAAKAKLKETRKELNKHKAELDYRRIEHQQYERLFQSEAIQRDQLEVKVKQVQAALAAYEGGEAAIESAQANIQVEDARRSKAAADVKSAQAHVEVARANLEQVKTMLQYGVIRAPYGGVITRRHVHTGAFIQSAVSGKPEPLVTLMRVDKPFRIVTDIIEAEAGWVKIGQPATLQVKSLPGLRAQGKVVRIAGALDTGTRMLRAEVELTTTPTGLRPGMFGSLTITVADGR